MVLPVAGFRVSHTLKKALRRFARTPGHEVRFDSDLRRVMETCAQTPREGQNGTWIVPEIIEAYTAWHHAGRAHSVETWVDGELVGGLYCVGLGRMVFGESMFARRTDASKIALCALVAWCRAQQVPLIDCQQHTRHLASFGAREIARREFETHISRMQGAGPAPVWSYHPAMWAQLGIEGSPAG
jgi:leucyl/phenylalanyl-tRNA--protein transferase